MATECVAAVAAVTVAAAVAAVAVVAVVVVEWLNYYKRIIIVRGADLSDFFFSLSFVRKMCVSVSRPMKMVTPKNWLLIFFGKERHSDQKSWKSSRISTKKSYNNNGKPWKSSRILRVKPNFFIFSLFIIFLHFFHFCVSLFLLSKV